MNQNMANMFGKFSELQEKVEEAKQELAKLEVEAEAGGGMVKVKANGKRQILSIKLDKDVIDPEDAEMMEDLVVAGVNKALDKAEEAAQERMQETYKDILPGGGMPGMDLSKLGL
ncbi:YbaB/EbfC family nucleoid-associated protein [Fodinibius sp.]|uniref:YbaB/EbfC family nucleoid-associated protein n=1 Tax=Fodinibius sp. TaxID=1872440 RepID=UPI002ACEF89B|nr:YbaB/EbfC family nucleoid-associated protein [Fodinibius sp.]MDZ7658919.1 YbaB/EbfC family nucleoid-associated protein [Fodinibius sp.]